MSTRKRAALLLLLTSCLLPAKPSANDDDWRDKDRDGNIQVGPRPFYLVEKMSPGPLKNQLKKCSAEPVHKTDFSIGHRGGGTLQFPEHTKESHEAGARMARIGRRTGVPELDIPTLRSRSVDQAAG